MAVCLLTYPHATPKVSLIGSWVGYQAIAKEGLLQSASIALAVCMGDQHVQIIKEP